MPMPKPGEEIKALFRDALPPDERVRVRLMFGNLSAFVNGNLFAGLFGDALFVRLAEPDRGAVLAESDAALFDPMPGRPMREYVLLPDAWLRQPEQLRHWLQRSLESTGALPPKPAKPVKPRKKQ